MAFAYATVPPFRAWARDEYACVGVPPEKEVAPEPPENGAVVAAIARVLRGALAAGRKPAPVGAETGQGEK